MMHDAVFSPAQLREYDRLATEEYGLPSTVLMEHAACAVRDAVLEELERRGERAAGEVLIVCGTGNNGGDGFAVARLLHNAGVRVRVVLVGDRDRVRGDALVNLTVLTRMGIAVGTPCEVASPAVVVDALLGTGATSVLREPVASAVQWINWLRTDGAFVVSVDVPSGMNAETGEPLGSQDAGAVLADHTVTFVGMKSGFLGAGAARFLGRVTVADIGAPRELASRVLGESQAARPLT
jgi:NAD(P)H-hydrate epimerase